MANLNFYFLILYIPPNFLHLLLQTKNTLRAILKSIHYIYLFYLVFKYKKFMILIAFLQFTTLHIFFIHIYLFFNLIYRSITSFLLYLKSSHLNNFWILIPLYYSLFATTCYFKSYKF